MPIFLALTPGYEENKFRIMGEEMRLSGYPASDLQFCTAQDAMTDVVYVIDQSYTVLLCNPGFFTRMRLLSIDLESVIGMDLFVAFTFLGQNVREEYTDVFRSGEVMVTEEDFVLGSETIHTETSRIPIIIAGKMQ